MTSRLAGVVLSLLMFAPAVVSAGTIQLTLATRVSIDGGRLTVELDLRNDGDEAALALNPSIEFQGNVVTGEAIAELGPAAAQTMAIVADAPPDVRGRWPVIVRVRYADAALSNFEAVHVDIVGDGGVPEAERPRITVPELRVETETSTSAGVDPRGSNLPLRLTFVTPASVVVTPRVHVVEAGSAAEVPLTVRNLTATPESRLPLVTVAEFEQNGVHDAVVSVSFIDIGAPRTDSRTLVITFLLAGSLLAWAVIAALAMRRRRAGND